MTPLAVPGRRAPPAASVLGSQLRFAETRDFDVGELTVDFWMSPGALPLGPRTWMLDNNMQYYATFEQSGAVRCGIGGTAVTSQRRRSTPVTGTTSPAPTRRPIRSCASMSTATSAAASRSTAIPQGGQATAIAIGANYGGGKFTEQYVGGLGRLHLYARALSDQEICQIATGGTGCNMGCQDHGGG